MHPSSRISVSADPNFIATDAQAYPSRCNITPTQACHSLQLISSMQQL
jgi:hypothetical protein